MKTILKRNRLRKFTACFLAIGILMAPELLAATTLLATTGDGESGLSTLLEIDPVTGVTLRTIGPVGYIVNGLEFDPSTGKLYGSTSASDWIDPPTDPYVGLIEIDMDTGAGTPVGPSGWGLASVDTVTNITIDASGQMYGWGEGWTGPDDLVRIDKATGIAILVGDSGTSTSKYGLDFDNTDTLYLIDHGDVRSVDVTTGLATAVGRYPTASDAAHHGDFDPATNRYYAIGPRPGSEFGPKFLEVVDPFGLRVERVPLDDVIHVLTFVADTLAPADHYRCYKVAKREALDIEPVDLIDQFGEDLGVEVKKPEVFCNPVVKNNEGDLVSPGAHLTCYKIKSKQPKRTIEIENQFGVQMLVIDDSKLVCVPTLKLSVDEGDLLDGEDDDDDDEGWKHRKHR